jgi:hypothetical protein
MNNFYLTNKAIGGVMLHLLPKIDLDDYTPDNTLTRDGWLCAEFANTGQRVLVRSKYNRRWLSAWSDFVTDFEVYEVDTVADENGVIWASKGQRKSLKLYTKTSHVEWLRELYQPSRAWRES